VSTFTALVSKEAEMRMIGCDLQATQQSKLTILPKKIECLCEVGATFPNVAASSED
jgi:hypothetical protein